MPEPKSKPPSQATGRFAYEGLERVFHEKARLGIMTSLISQPRGVVFADLKELCHLTDGNLSRHLQVLHEAGLGGDLEGIPQATALKLCAASPTKAAAGSPSTSTCWKPSSTMPERGPRRCLDHRCQPVGRLVPA